MTIFIFIKDQNKKGRNVNFEKLKNQYENKDKHIKKRKEKRKTTPNLKGQKCDLLRTIRISAISSI